MAKVYIGTSGYTYQHWRGVFYPQDLRQKDWLGYYAKYFETVEINASFYHQMGRKVYENWRAKTPENFVFAIKGSRFITHIKRLKDCQEPLERFFQSAIGLEEKLGVILWQLPPRWGADEKRLASFLSLIDNLRFKNVRQAFEFRENSWFSSKIYAMLKKFGGGLVIADSPFWPKEEVFTADFMYLRFHGRESLYASSYSGEELREWAKKIAQLRGENLDVYAYFNNDIKGYAVQNALRLKELVKS